MEDKLSPEKLKFKDYDLLSAVDFTARGRIEAKTLQGYTPYFGDVRLQVAEVRALRSTAFGGETSVQLEAAKFCDVGNTTWMETDIELSGDMPVEIVASGQISLYRGGGYESGPRGHASYTSGTHPSGAVLARVGSSGEIFIVGEKFVGTPKREWQALPANLRVAVDRAVQWELQGDDHAEPDSVKPRLRSGRVGEGSARSQ